MDAAEGRDFLMHAYLGMLRALNSHVERGFDPPSGSPAQVKSRFVPDRVGDRRFWTSITGYR
jgi:hypothetical protein